MTLGIKKQSTSQHGAFWVCIFSTAILTACCIGIAGLPVLGIKIAFWAAPIMTAFTAAREIVTIHNKRTLAEIMQCGALAAAVWFVAVLVGSIVYMWL